VGTTTATTHKISAGKGMTSLGQATRSHTNLRKVSVYIHTISIKIIYTEQTSIDINKWIHKTIFR
jgi:hypothetical protein